MITLFIDTSTDTLTVSIINDDVILDAITLPSSEHSKYAMSAIESIFDKNNIKRNSVNKIMVVNGPGSFTGIRIGVTIAKIYAWACNINVVPISTLKAYAISNMSYKYYISSIDARRNYVYAAIYDSNYNNILDESYINKDDLINKIIKLEDYLIISNTPILDFNTVKPKLDIKRIYDYYKNDIGINCHALKPVYLKEVEAVEKMGGYND